MAGGSSLTPLARATASLSSVVIQWSMDFAQWWTAAVLSGASRIAVHGCQWAAPAEKRQRAEARTSCGDSGKLAPPGLIIGNDAGGGQSVEVKVGRGGHGGPCADVT